MPRRGGACPAPSPTPGPGAPRHGRSRCDSSSTRRWLFALDLLILALYPWLVGAPNPLTDILGTFLGLLTFVGGPVILWFALTYEQLRGMWKLERRRIAL